MHSGDTIAALASGWARSACALVRMSGPQTPGVLAGIFEPAVAMPERPTVISANLQLPAESARTPPVLPLPVLVLVYPAPRSYTGEHAAEILVPGNPALVERVLALLTSLAMVREATPGEFSARAYFSGRLSLEQAEGVAALIGARTDEELKAARRLLGGEIGGRYRAWAEELATLLALVEAGIDFTDQEDVLPIAPGELTRRVAALRADMEGHLGVSRGSERADRLPSVVLAGSPNAGKSTLFNALLGRRRAVVSPVAGTTRDALSEELDLAADSAGGGRIRLIDLPGLGGAADPLDAQAQVHASRIVEAADIVLLCDPAGRFALVPAGPAKGRRPVIRVRTMADRPVTDGGAGDVAVCALDGWNLGLLRRAIADAAWAGAAGSATDLAPRHRRVLTEACSRLTDAEMHVRADGPALGSPELVAGALRGAMDLLGELVGRVAPDDVIGRIFATFCVGK